MNDAMLTWAEALIFLGIFGLSMLVVWIYLDLKTLAVVAVLASAQALAGTFVYRTPYNYDMVQGMGYTAGIAFQDAVGSIPWGFAQSGGEHFRCQYSVLQDDICTAGDFVIATFPVSRVRGGNHDRR